VQALNSCEFSVGVYLDGKVLAIPHGTELEVLFCAKLHLDLLEPKLSDDGLCLFTGDRPRCSLGLIWNSECHTALEPLPLGAHDLPILRGGVVPRAWGRVISLLRRPFIIGSRPEEATEALAGFDIGSARKTH
jgi:hypothetical protein